jgi:hypothetical protein
LLHVVLGEGVDVLYYGYMGMIEMGLAIAVMITTWIVHVHGIISYDIRPSQSSTCMSTSPFVRLVLSLCWSGFVAATYRHILGVDVYTSTCSWLLVSCRTNYS